MKQYYTGPIRRITIMDFNMKDGEVQYKIQSSQNTKDKYPLEWDEIMVHSTIIKDNIEFYYNHRQKLLTRHGHFPVTRAEDVHDIIVNDIKSGTQSDISVVFVNPLELTKKTLSKQKPEIKQRVKSIFKKGRIK